MSSTGIIGKVNAAPDNHYSQSQKNMDQQISSFPMLETSREVLAKVSEVDPDRPKFVKAVSLDDPRVHIANAQWIKVNHGDQEIVDRWGKIRIGFKLRILFNGPTEDGAVAYVTGSNDEETDTGAVSNEQTMGLWAIFAPGIGPLSQV